MGKRQIAVVRRWASYGRRPDPLGGPLTDHKTRHDKLHLFYGDQIIGAHIRRGTQGHAISILSSAPSNIAARRAIMVAQRVLAKAGMFYMFAPYTHTGWRSESDATDHYVKCNFKYVKARVYQARLVVVNRRTTEAQLDEKMFYYNWWLRALGTYAAITERSHGEEIEPIADYMYRHNAKLYALIAMADPAMKILEPLPVVRWQT